MVVVGNPAPMAAGRRSLERWGTSARSVGASRSFPCACLIACRRRFRNRRWIRASVRSPASLRSPRQDRRGNRTRLAWMGIAASSRKSARSGRYVPSVSVPRDSFIRCSANTRGRMGQIPRTAWRGSGPSPRPGRRIIHRSRGELIRPLMLDRRMAAALAPAFVGRSLAHWLQGSSCWFRPRRR